jgi:hypothetical protein
MAWISLALSKYLLMYFKAVPESSSFSLPETMEILGELEDY